MDQVAEIREKIDLVGLIGEYVTLKRAGRNFKANCPFHTEKTPSFVVSLERQLFHCFGCQKGGDCYTFLMEYEHMEFPEALRFLAKRAGVELVQSPGEAASSSRKEKLYQINRLAAEYYHYVLTSHPAGKNALAYFKERGVSEKVIKSFLLGFAPTSNGLTRYLMGKKKYEKELLVEAGLTSEWGGQVRDFFRSRMMFPLLDHRENVVGFSGRLFGEGDGVKAKYINTRDTLVYHKGQHFFGLNMTKDAIRKANQAILVEGEFDVLSCFQSGVGNVAAVKGTALTEQQVRLLSRFASKVTMCFDGDRAGQEAIKRSLPLLEKQGLTTSVIVIPNGKDPDEALKTDAALFKKAVREDIGIYDYLLEQTVKTHSTRTAEGKERIAGALLPVFSVITNEIIKEHYLRKLSRELDTSYESLLREVARSSKEERVPSTPPSSSEKRSREEVLEEYLLSLIVQSEAPKRALTQAVEILSSSLPKERAYQKLIEQLVSYFAAHEQLDGQRFTSSLPTELSGSYDKVSLFPLPSFDSPDRHVAEIEKTARKLHDIYVKERIKQVGTRIKETEKTGDEQGAASLREEFSHLVTQLKK